MANCKTFLFYTHTFIMSRQCDRLNKKNFIKNFLWSFSMKYSINLARIFWL
ncbi:unnamed protein product [Meloidogyne enterolobii]|uniref:Uncharacterized protein n=1 Tax=Meloidogyne enterolobii TaxID=390850 RepID=A0ACB1A7Y1_MELEN